MNNYTYFMKICKRIIIFQIVTNQTLSNNDIICKVPDGWGLMYNLQQRWFVGTYNMGGNIVSRINFTNDHTFTNISLNDISNLFCSGCYISE